MTTQESRRKGAFRALVTACAFVAALQPLAILHEASAKTISYERGISKVKGFIARKQYNDAERLLSALLRDYPGNPEILSIRGRVNLWNGKPSAAINDFNHSLRRREDTSIRSELTKAETAEKISRANDFLSQGRTANAEGILTSLFDARRDRYSSGLLLGRSYTNTGNYGKARDLYRTLHQDYPRDHDNPSLRSLTHNGRRHREGRAGGCPPPRRRSSVTAPLSRDSTKDARGLCRCAGVIPTGFETPE